MKRRVCILFVPALLLAACSGGDGDSDTVSGAEWCALAQQVEDSSNAYEASLDGGGEALGVAFDEFAALLDAAKAAAPAEIEDAVKTSADGIKKFGELLGEVDYDLFALDESALAELEAMSGEMATATAEIETYNERECGITAESEDSEAALDSAPDSEEIASTVATVASATASPSDPTSDWCVAARKIEDAGNPLEAVDLSDPKAVESAVTEMIGFFQDAVDVAPADLAGDIAISFEAIKDLETALREADWDLLDADLSMLEEDEFSIAAKDNIAAYNERVCGIPIDDEDDGDGGVDGFDPQAGTIREQAIAELVKAGFTETEAACVFDNFDFSDPESSTDPTIIMGVLALCGIDVDRLADLGG